MAKMSVYAELCAAAAMPEPKDATNQTFLAKLWKAIDGLDDKDWELLGEPAQKWANSAAAAKKADKDFPLIKDAPKPSSAEEEAGEDEAGEAPVAKKAVAKKGAAAPKKAATPPAKKAAAAPAAKKAAASGAKKAAGEKPKKSMLRSAREIICKAPHLNVEQIIAKLETAGYEAAPVTIGTIRSDTRNTLKIAQELNVDLEKMDFDK